MANTIRKNLGMVTAYAYAVSKGYTGTEEEFAELMASYADVAQDAEASAQVAAQSATTAERKATQAAGSATSASESAQVAAGSSNSASLYAQNASASATNAAGSASSASIYAGNASASAQAAEGFANNAQASANAAAGSASAAQTSAQTAAGSATESANSATSAQGHAAAASESATQAAGSAADAAQSAEDAGEAAEEAVKEGLADKAPVVFNSASGSIASFLDGADDMSMKSVVVTIEPIQEGSGDPSPENVRPISGRTGLSVVRCGKNLIDFASVYENIQTITFSDGVWTGPGNAFWNARIQIPKAFIGKTLVFSAELTTQGSNARVAATIDGVTKNGTPVANTDVVKSVLVITPVSEDDTIWINYSSPGTTTVKNPKLELGSTATDYEPYKGSTYSVNWETEAGTVYGGTLDIVSGKLTVDRAKRTFTGEASENWRTAGTQDDGYFRFYTDAVSDRAYGSSINGTHLCNYLKPTSGWAVNSSSGIIINNSCSMTLFGNMVRIYLNMSGIISELSVTALNTYLAEHPLDLCYLLATPTEIQLTPQEVRTLLGVNNIWSDAGDMVAEYPADTKMYIDQKITEAIAAAMA